MAVCRCALKRARGLPVVDGAVVVESADTTRGGLPQRLTQALALWHLARDERRGLAGAGQTPPRADAADAVPGDVPPPTLWSPDGRWGLRRLGDDVALVGAEDGALRCRTHDGEPGWAYGGWPDVALCSVALARSGLKLPPAARWSADGRYAVIARIDQRRVRQLLLVDSIGIKGQPVAYRQHVPMPGDAELPLTTLVILDVEAEQFRNIDMPAMPSSYAPIVPAVADAKLAALLPADTGIVRWAGNRLLVVREARGWQDVQVLLVDPATGQASCLVRETGVTHVQLAAQRYPAQLALLSEGRLVFYSERDGWGHLWTQPCAGEPLQLTRGEWTVRQLHHVDEPCGLVFFSASGREPGVDPYHRLLYVMPLAGGEPRRLTPDDADHDVRFDAERLCWLADGSRIDDPGALTELTATGEFVKRVARPARRAAAALRAEPLRFNVKAADGITDLYGVLFLPNPTPGRAAGIKHPLLDHVYGAPQRTQASVRHGLSASVRADDTLALTSLGFAVFVLDGRGTPYRGKAFHDHAWGLGHADACGLADHAAAVAQIAAQFECVDASRVGIFGASGGGYAAARAVMLYPQVFHAAFASAGNHDQRLYCARYERYLGMLPQAAAAYDAADNTALAIQLQLQRPLLLAHGLLDDDVHPSASLRLFEALQRAGKPVELLTVPQGGHNIETLDSVLLRKWQFFCDHLHP